MVIGLVNAGVMTLMQATPIIMGANIGTTITGVLVALKNDYFDMLIVLYNFQYYVVFSHLQVISLKNHTINVFLLLSYFFVIFLRFAQDFYYMVAFYTSSTASGPPSPAGEGYFKFRIVKTADA